MEDNPQMLPYKEVLINYGLVLFLSYCTSRWRQFELKWWEQFIWGFWAVNSHILTTFKEVMLY